MGKMSVREVWATATMIVSAIFIVMYFITNEAYRELTFTIYRDHTVIVIVTLIFVVSAYVQFRLRRKRAG